MIAEQEPSLPVSWLYKTTLAMRLQFSILCFWLVLRKCSLFCTGTSARQLGSQDCSFRAWHTACSQWCGLILPRGFFGVKDPSAPLGGAGASYCSHLPAVILCSFWAVVRNLSSSSFFFSSPASGTAIITEEHAAMWTDGRYFLQAAKQMDSNWTLMKMGGYRHG